MRRTQFICALALAFAIGLTVPVPQEAQALCVGICTDSIELGAKRIEELFDVVDTQIENFDQWNQLVTAVEQLEGQYSSAEIDNLKAALVAAGADVTGWESKTLPDMIILAEATPGYETNDALKNSVAGVQLMVNGIVTTIESAVATIDPTASLGAGASATQIINEVKNLPNYEKYQALVDAWNTALHVDETGTGFTIEQLTTIYEDLYQSAIAIDGQLDLSSVDAILETEEKKDEEKTARASGDSAKELQEYVNQARADEKFAKYESLIKAVDEGQTLLETLQAPAARATSESGDATIGNSIQNIGNAMRDLGSNTTIGQNLSNPTRDDLASAIAAAKQIDNYAKYEALVRSVWQAEEALRGGTTDSAAIGEIITNLQKAIADLKVPNTGTPAVQSDGNANWSGSIFAGIAALITTIAGILAVRRQLARRNRLKLAGATSDDLALDIQKLDAERSL